MRVLDVKKLVQLLLSFNLRRLAHRYDIFYMIVQILVSITNQECNIAATKTVLMRFDGIKNSIFFIISILFTKTNVTSNGNGTANVQG